jgi:hypothetical protein
MATSCDQSAARDVELGAQQEVRGMTAVPRPARHIIHEIRHCRSGCINGAVSRRQSGVHATINMLHAYPSVFWGEQSTSMSGFGTVDELRQV